MSIIGQLDIYYCPLKIQNKIRKFGLLRYLMLPCIALSEAYSISGLLKCCYKTNGLFMLVCYLSMKIVVFCVLKFNHAVSHFLVLLEAYTQCSSQEGIN